MNIKQVILGGIFGVVLQLGAATPVISNVVAQQHCQSNGLVDVTVTMQGVSNDVARAVCTFVATNGATKAAIPVAHIMQNGDVAGEGTIWTRKFIWEAKADIGEVKIEDVALTVVVDLSLGGVQLWEGGPYWAECNVGATKPEEYGYYFWWGDAIGYKRSIYGWLISVKDSSQLFFSSENCPTYDMDNSLLYSEGYIDSTGNLAAAHDAATVDFGGPWRMPTGDEFLALVNNCQTTWTTCNGVNGRMVTGKGAYSSKSIFLPAAGSVERTEVFDLGSRGRYWSSSPTSGFPKCTEALLFDASGFSAGSNSRYAGQPIRPVREFATSMADGATIHVALDFRVQPLPQGGPYTETVDGIEWTFMVNADLEVRVGGVSASRAISQSTTGEIAIPSELGGRPVTSIGVEAFRGCSGLTSVSIPPGVTSIGDGAFCLCSRLASVTISEGVTSIGRYAFSGCSGLTGFAVDASNPNYCAIDGLLCSKDGKNLVVGVNGSVVIPEGVASIGDYAFSGYSGLTSVTIPEGVTSIGDSAFSDCSALTSMVIPSSVLSIEFMTFGECSGLTNVVFCGDSTVVMDEAFLGCVGLADENGFVIVNGTLQDYCGDDYMLDIPEGVVRICSGVFWGREVQWQYSGFGMRIPSSVKSIGDAFPFYDTGSLPVWDPYATPSEFTIYITDLTSWCQIEWDAPQTWPCHFVVGEEEVEHLVIPGVITEVKDYAFSGCAYLKSVAIPPSVGRIGTQAFEGCGLEEVRISDLSAWCEITFEDWYSNPLSYECKLILDEKELTDLVIPEGVTVINDYVFKGCTKLASVTIPLSVTNIGHAAFYECSCLTAVTIPAGVIDIESDVFMFCRVLSAVDFEGAPPEGVSVAAINADAAIRYNAKYESEWLPVIAKCGWVNATPYAPESADEPVEPLPKGGPYTETVDGVEWTFMVNSDLTASVGGGSSDSTGVQVSMTGDVSVPTTLGGRSVTSFGPYAFYDCRGLTSVSIPNGVTNISERAFAGCTSLRNAEIPSTVENIGSYAFNGCTSLMSVTLPNCLRTISNSAFRRCKALTSISIPHTVTSIGNDSFEECVGLTSVDIPSAVTSIGAYAFSGCEELATVELHEGLERIGGSAFSRCSKLSSYSIPISVLSVSRFSFNGTKRYLDVSAAAADCIIMDDCLFCLTSTALSNIKNLAVPSGVRVIADNAFVDATNLESATLPDTVRAIGASAFYGSSISSIAMPTDSVRIIGNSAFEASHLVDIDVPDGVETIMERALPSVIN